MKTKYGIGIFILCIILIYLIFSSAYGKNEIINEKEDAIDSVTTDVTISQMDGFYLYEINGYVVVFKSDRKTPYEYTDISYETLPELLKKEIRNGKYIADQETLYGFLENYSS